MLTDAELKILDDLDEAAGAAAFAPLTRAKKKKAAKAVRRAESRRIRETALVGAGAVTLPAAAGAHPLLEGPIVKVVLLTEGLGNQRDMNYYGPEAVRSMPLIFEGAPMMVDHLSESEEEDIPEGRVNKTVGYYKNLRAESVDGRLACVGEVHFDLSEEGRNAYEKARTAIHYHEEFPGTEREYVGLSINAAGESEPRTMLVDGQETQVNYVTRFVDARSCDMVTIPARGGRFVALMESISGARLNKEATRMETLKRLEAAQAALKEAESEKNSEQRQRKVAEARKEVESLLKDIREAAAKKAKEAEDESESEGEDESESGKEMGDGCESKEESEDGADGDGDDDGASHTTVTHKVVRKTGKAAMAGDKESRRLAVRALIAESGLNPKFFDAEELARLTLSEAKREIARTKRVHEATAEEFLKKYGADVSAAHPTRESGGGNSSNGDGTLNDQFAELPA